MVQLGDSRTVDDSGGFMNESLYDNTRMAQCISPGVSYVFASLINEAY